MKFYKVIIDILGSCVTRDAFRYYEGNSISVGAYFAPSSLVSIYSPPIEFDIQQINLESDFQKRMVYWDITSEFRHHITSNNSDVLLIDFIDERFPVLKMGDSYVTESNEFIRSGVKQSLPFVSYRIGGQKM